MSLFPCSTSTLTWSRWRISGWRSPSGGITRRRRSPPCSTWGSTPAAGARRTGSEWRMPWSPLSETLCGERHHWHDTGAHGAHGAGARVRGGGAGSSDEEHAQLRLQLCLHRGWLSNSQSGMMGRWILFMIRRLVQSQIRLFIDIDIVHVFKLTSVELKECNVREEILDVASSEQKKRIEKFSKCK